MKYNQFLPNLATNWQWSPIDDVLTGTGIQLLRKHDVKTSSMRALVRNGCRAPVRLAGSERDGGASYVSFGSERYPFL